MGTGADLGPIVAGHCALCGVDDLLYDDGHAIRGVCASCLIASAWLPRRAALVGKLAETRIHFSARKTMRAILAIYSTNGFLPLSLQQISDCTGHSKSTVRLHVLALRKAGLVDQDDESVRSIRPARV